MSLTQQFCDQRSLALHSLAAEKLKANPALLGWARDLVERWLLTASVNVKPYHQAWLDLIDRGQDAVLQIMTEQSERADALRQASPFSCCLSPQERTAFFLNFQCNEKI